MVMKKVFLLFMLCIINAVFANQQAGYSDRQNLGSNPYFGNSSPGTIWPKPQSQTSTSETFPVDSSLFQFVYSKDSKICPILDEAFRRYGKLIIKANAKLKLFASEDNVISSVSVTMKGAMCESVPSAEMNEAYTLDVSASVGFIMSESVWGILNGLESFSQLLYVDNVGGMIVNKTSIVDFPRFAYRAVMLDTSRHYIPINVIKENLDAMAYNKFNVFHWHIVDIQSFPYVSKTYPDLSAKGAFDPVSHIYTPVDVHEVIGYAALRGIRVVPEFDTPGHTDSWGKGQPNLLTPCYSNGKPDGSFGPMDPTVQTTYDFMENLLMELEGVFPDKYIHLGGDEVSFNCWKSNPKITAWMKAKNISGNYAKLEEVYVQQILNITANVGLSYIIWQEVVDNGCKVNPDTVVEVWKSNDPMGHVANFTKMGLRTIISQPWYLNYISYGDDWIKYYDFEPLNFNGTADQKKLVIGGEACIWGEYVDATNVLSRLWPRASAVAERLWSAASMNNSNEAAPRLHQHRCRLINRNIPAEPLSPGYCNHEWRNV